MVASSKYMYSIRSYITAVPKLVRMKAAVSFVHLGDISYF